MSKTQISTSKIPKDNLSGVLNAKHLIDFLHKVILKVVISMLLKNDRTLSIIYRVKTTLCKKF